MILLEIIVLALGLSLLTGGQLRNLEHERLRGERLLLVLLPLQVGWPRLAALMGMSCAVSLAAWLLMMLSLVVVLMLNAPQRWALGVAALGILLNVMVISLNGTMPVSMQSVSEIGVLRVDAMAKLGADCLHGVLHEGTRAPLLADVIAIPGPYWQRSVVSVGDLVLAAGLGGWVFVAARERET